MLLVYLIHLTYQTGADSVLVGGNGYSIGGWAL